MVTRTGLFLMDDIVSYADITVCSWDKRTMASEEWSRILDQRQQDCLLY